MNRKPSSLTAGAWSRRTALSGLLAAGGCAVAPAAMVNLVQAPPSPGPDGQMLETAFDATTRMTVPVRLEGKGPLEFVVDTGANVSVVAREIAQQLGLPNIGQALVHGIAGSQLTDLTQVRKLNVGTISEPVPRMPIMPRGRLGADGLLGMDILRGRRLIMDYRNRRLDIARSGPRPSAMPTFSLGGVRQGRDPLFVVPARIRFGQLIIVDAEIAGVKVVAFLDSGSQNTVGNGALKAAVARRNTGFAERLYKAPLISATGQTMVGEIAAMPPLRLGGLLVGNMSIAFADLHIFTLWELTERPALLVGADVLRQFNSVEIDYGRRLVTFRPPAEYMRRNVR
ncbi:aspartyl protease family protein [Phenylobacterium sp.]|uniref:aspartyl protease family protein n=1 Tax=Phenylobacterium sp. TaxID=1871053 RepID=UPI002E2F548E|nr:aspartyl protease family protein [Phenylobacterium sp.]HEX2559714.1 aspartyl protease family protein [Phenylobacterium sp.]